MEAIWPSLDPVLERLRDLDLREAPAVERALTETFGRLPELEALCRENLELLCPKGEPPVRFGRLAKDRHGFSVDAVVSDGPGTDHTHVAGEVDYCFALDGAPRFDGRDPGWVVYPPGSRHDARVEGGRMFILYFLPGGRIEWHRGG